MKTADSIQAPTSASRHSVRPDWVQSKIWLAPHKKVVMMAVANKIFNKNIGQPARGR